MNRRPQPDDRDLQPRSTVELADVAVAAFKRSFGPLVTVSVAFAVPATIVFWIALATGWRPAVIVGAVVLAVGLALAHAACVDVVGDEWFGASPTAAAAIRRTVKRAPQVVLLWLEGGLRVALLTLLLIVPGVMAALSLVPAVPTMVLERVKPTASVRRAAVLSRYRRGAHLGALLACLALVAAGLLVLVQPVVVAAVIGTGRDAPTLVGAAALQVAMCALVVPLFGAVSTAAYVDARVRKEGLDLLFLLNAMDDDAAAEAAVVAASA